MTAVRHVIKKVIEMKEVIPAIVVQYVVMEKLSQEGIISAH